MNEKYFKMKELINSLSHDIHGQVGILRIKAKLISKIVPDLMENYQKLKEGDGVEKVISENLLNNIDDLLALNEQLSEILRIVDSAQETMNSSMVLDSRGD